MATARQLNHQKTKVCVVNLLAAIFGNREIKGFREKGKLVNVDTIVNITQIVKTATCLMTITQYNSNNSLTPDFK